MRTRPPSPPSRAKARGWLPAFVLVSCLTVLASPAAPGQLTSEESEGLHALLDAPPFHRASWGVLALTHSGDTLFSRAPDRFVVPGSTAKLLVAAAALLLLPPDLVATNSVYGTGAVDGGIVRGDLVLYGRGDPSLARRCYGVDTTAAGVCDDLHSGLEALAESIQARGIRRVAGSVIGDGSYFETTLLHPAWEVYDVNWYYAAPVSGLSYNDNSIDFNYAPAARTGAPPIIDWTPKLDLMTFENRSRTAPRGSRRTIDFFRVPGTWRIWAEGNVPLGQPPRTEYFAVPDPNLFAAIAFRHALEARGIVVEGKTGSTVDSLRYRVARNRPPLAEYRGRPLRDVVFPILNSSHNLMSEMLLKQLGRQFRGEGSWDAGKEVVERVLVDSVGLSPSAFALVDASGLSPRNLVTPRALVSILTYMRRHPRGQPFMDALPQAGARGSLLNRFAGTPAAGRVTAKTGTLTTVSALAGFVERSDGEVVTFAIAVNRHSGRPSTATRRIDQFVTRLARP